MDDREANIDLLFRKGLKDYEVLPPAEVWDKISPAIRKQQRPYIILRAAAMIAVLATLSFLTYTWENELSDSVASTVDLQNNMTGTPEIETSDALFLADAGNIKVKKPHKSITIINPDITIAETVGKDSEVILSNILKAGILPESETVINRPYLILPVTSASKSLSIDYYPAPYINEITATEKKEKWTIAALVSPTYLSSFSSGNNEAVSQLNQIEQPVISYAGGFALAYKVSKRFSVQSGLYYASYGNELTGITSFGGFQNYDQFKGNSNFEVQTSNGTVYTNNNVYLIDNLSDTRVASFFDKSSFDPTKASLEYLNNSLRQNLGYLELPLILRYKVIDRTFDFNIIGGLSSNLLVNNSVYASVDGEKYEVGKTEGLNTILFSSSLGMGMEYSITNNLSFNFEPTFRYYLNSFNNFAGMSSLHPYSFGVFSGLSYKF